MNKPANTIQASNRTTLAKMYNVGYVTFNSWIEINPQLKALLHPYLSAGKRTLPPEIVKKVFEILGEP